MRLYLKDITSPHAHNNTFDDIKLSVCERLQKSMYDLSKVLTFAMDEDNLGRFDQIIEC